MRRILVGFVTLVLLASCTDDPTVTEERLSATFETETVTEPPPSPTPTPAPEFEVEAEAEVAEPAQGEQVAENDGLFPTVVDVSASLTGDQSWRFDVTLSSEYDSPDRYADAWRVLDGNDNELGIRVLGHDHANEQPFTRSHTIEVPTGITTVFVEGRDQLNGWSGERFELTLTS